MRKKFLLLAEKIFKRILSLNKIQKIFFLFFFFFVLLGLGISFLKIYYRYSKEIPNEGGILKIGIIGSPQYINPVLTRSNDVDRFLIEIFYNGLLKVDGQGNLANDLASKIEISPDKRNYLIFLKENVFWHDGVPFTTDDVIFTIETIQNKDYKSPLKDSWEGIVVEKISSSVIRFTLNRPYQPFLQNLTLKIIPKHIWENINPKSFPLTDYNIKPIGTGPFLFENLEKDKQGNVISCTLAKNEKYFEGSPYILKLKFIFYNSYEEMKKGLLKGEINTMFPVKIEDLDYFQKSSNYRINRLELYRYFAVFFNLEKDLFKDKNIREALDLAINKKTLYEEILRQEAKLLDNPFTFLSKDEEILNNYNPLKAQETFKEKNISFTLIVPEEYQLIKIAQFLQQEWNRVGASVEIQIVPYQELEREILLIKDYEALLFGEIINQSLDLYSFWHSSRAGSYKLNLSNYKNKELDKLIEENWNIEEEKMKENLLKIREIFVKEKPAIFLYNPYYLYLVPKSLKGNNVKLANLPSEIFSDISYWYLKTQRVLKLK